jgi:hypothetical protein
MKRVAFSLLTGIAVCLLTLIVWKSLQDYQAAQPAHPKCQFDAASAARRT